MAAASTLNLVGSLAQKKGMKIGDYTLLEKAEESLKEALAIRLSVLSRSDPDLGQSLDTVANFYLEQGNLPEAEDHFHRAREVGDERAQKSFLGLDSAGSPGSMA